MSKLLAAAIALTLLAPSAALAADRDGDGIEDEEDAFPDHVTVGVASLTGRRVIRSDHVGKIREDVTAGLHFFENHRFALCEATCLFGAVKKTGKKRKLRLRFGRAARKALADQLEFAIENELFARRGRVHDIHFDFDGKRKMIVVISKDQDRVKLKLNYQHDARVRRPKPRKRLDGRTKLDLRGAFSGFVDR